MSFVVVVAVLALALFGMVFFTKRRMGVMGLALAAGAMLAELWVGDLTPIIQQAGLVIVQPPLKTLVAAVLILLPAVLLMSSGTAYKTLWQRILGAITFSMLAIALLLPSLGAALVVDGAGQPVYDFLWKYQAVIVTAGLAISIVDIVMTKLPKYAKH